MMIKKIGHLLLVLCLTFNLFACQNTNTPIQDFNTFIDECTTTLLDGTTHFNMHFLVNDPSSINIKESDTYGIGFTNHDQYQKTMQTYQTMLTDLKKYSNSNLDKTQQIVKKNFQNYLERELLLKDDYYFSNDLIGSYSSLQQEIPMLLELYTINSTSDIDYLILDIQALENDFKQYIEHELTRQTKGYGYAKDVIDLASKHAKKIYESKGQSIYQSVCKKIDLLQLDSKLSNEYKFKVKTVLENDYANAYLLLSKELEQISTTTPTTLGVSYYPSGKDYYCHIVQNQLGTSKSIETIEKEILQTKQKAFKNLIHVATKYRDEIINDDYLNIKYKDAPDPTTGLNYLKTKITKDFPKLDNLNFQVYQVPKDNQDGFAPAAYLQGKIDMKETDSESIMINPKSNSNLMSTLIHEGYPGHMYQHAYLRQKNYPTIMLLTDCIGYTEGWAIYTENYTSQFVDDKKEKALTQIMQADTNYTNLLLAYADIQINYSGWTYEQFHDYMCEEIGGEIGDLTDIYMIICQTPGYYLYYIYAGNFIQSLYDTAKNTLKEKFNPKEFHQVILDSGAIGLDLLKENIDLYIEGA